MSVTEDTTDADTSRARRPLTVQRAIMMILGLQIVLALILMGRDLLSALPHLAFRSTQPAFDTPVIPGDQTRRYSPGDLPLAPARDGAPARPYTSTNDMPQRISLDVRDGVLQVTGAIAPGDARRFADFLEAAAEDVTRVRLNSPGGAVDEALSIGRQIRAAELETFLGASDICLSACPYILAGGTERMAHPESQVGVHQHYFGTNTVLPAFLAVEDIQHGQGEVMTYLDSMGIDILLMRHALVTPPDEIYVLLPEQLETYRLAMPVVH
jgi:hypothetical protein